MNNKEIDIYYFTGTGNTYLATKKIAQTFTENGCSVRLFDIAKSNPLEIDFTKTLGFGFPTACWNTFPFVRRFFYNLPQSFGTEVFVFSTMGDSSLRAAAMIGDILKNKGYNVIATKGFKMPNNLIAIQSEAKNIVKREKAYLKIQSFAIDIFTEKSKAESVNIFLKFCFKISSFITNLWESKISQKIIRFKVSKKECTKCMLCVNICPVKNISFEDFPVFNGNKCQICMRCISYCPTNSIKSFLVRKGKTYKGLNQKESEECFDIR